MHAVLKLHSLLLQQLAAGIESDSLHFELPLFWQSRANDVQHSSPLTLISASATHFLPGCF